MTSAPLKALFIVASLKRGGAEVQVVELVNGLDPVIFSKHLSAFEPGLDLLDRLDRATVVFHHSPRRNKYDYSGVREIATIIDKQSIDIVHCTLQMSLLRGWLGARLSKRKPKLVVALHTTVNISKKAELLRLVLMQWLMRSCKQVICVCKAQEVYWQDRFPFLKGKTTVIYNGVDTAHFDPALFLNSRLEICKQLGISPKSKIISHIAGFRREKGHATLADALAEVLKQRQDVFLLFVGVGETRPRIEERVKTLGIENNVRFLGGLSDVRAVLGASDLSVIASTVETFSMAMLESMAMQVPMVATDVGGTREAVIPGETGFLAQPQDSGALAVAIVTALADESERIELGQNARRFVMERFTRDAMIEQTGCLLQSVAMSG